jgi:predicted dehydrogenase/aryl-alcohol dehydrogenase-like predicted oxidoreductase
MAGTLGWGILGTGTIARRLAGAIRASTTSHLVAVGSRTRSAAEAFAGEAGIPRAYGSYDELLADPEVQAVYIALPNHLHAQWTVRAAEAGRHILCEKPMATNHAEAMTAIDAVRRHDVFFMEAFMYRCHPQTARIAALVRSGAIGEVRCVDVRFSYNMEGRPPGNIRRSNEAAGGGVMDVGCYAASMARLVAGAASGQDFADPLMVSDGYQQEMDLRAFAHVDPSDRVDHWTTAVSRFPGDVVATLAVGVMVRAEHELRIFGSRGRIVVPNPWFPGDERFGGEAGCRVLVYRDGAEQPEEHACGAGTPLYTIEVDTVAGHIARRQAPPPAMSWADSLGNMRVLDAWRAQIGLAFDAEKPQALRLPTSGRPLARLSSMPSGLVDGIDKPVSRLVMGTMIFKPGRLPLACAMLDAYYQAGGNCIDTAHVYRSEQTVGEWIRLRGVRGDLVVIGKGGRDAAGTPTGISAQLLETLDAMQLDYLDLYLMHTDNLSVPVGELVECLDTHRRAGRIRAYGGSNWSPQRLEAANDYARAHGMAPFAASSPNLSLAVWNEPMWPGCVSAADRGSRDWYARTRLPLFAWSSQATGFFSGRYEVANREAPGTERVAKTWFNEGNFERLARVRELAQRRRVTPSQVALAWVLSQPFPTFALVGPQTVDELNELLPAAALTLTGQEVSWLNLEDQA